MLKVFMQDKVPVDAGSLDFFDARSCRSPAAQGRQAREHSLVPEHSFCANTFTDRVQVFSRHVQATFVRDGSESFLKARIIFEIITEHNRQVTLPKYRLSFSV